MSKPARAMARREEADPMGYLALHDYSLVPLHVLGDPLTGSAVPIEYVPENFGGPEDPLLFS